MKLTKEEVCTIVTHEVGHVVAAIGTGTPIFSAHISTQPKGKAGCHGSVNWGQSKFSHKTTAIVAIAGIVAEYLEDAGDPTIDDTTWLAFNTYFRTQCHYKRDLEIIQYSETMGYGIRNAAEKAAWILTSLYQIEARLKKNLLKKQNQNRNITAGELLQLAGVELRTKDGVIITKSKVSKFMRDLVENPQPCKYRILE